MVERRGRVGPQRRPTSFRRSWEFLGMQPRDEIKRAYRAAGAAAVHPDVSDDPDAARQFRRLVVAFETLMDAGITRRHLGDTEEAELSRLHGLSGSGMTCTAAVEAGAAKAHHTQTALPAVAGRRSNERVRRARSVDALARDGIRGGVARAMPLDYEATRSQFQARGFCRCARGRCPGICP